MTNRVDELEGDVAELRAAVNGLTEELVETKERVRQLENAAEAEQAEKDAAAARAAETNTSGVVETTTKSDDHVEVVEHERREVDVMTADETEADGFEAADVTDPAGESEGANTTEEDESTETDADHSEIIVA